ncbi:hypothetical protein HF888_06785 [Bermanella marisrubri]|uniref:Putative secreted protein n=1 Tax=Bermanella marisrubri TaxID=207949 RepID=Q1N599_9GAMM|nr:MBL fold metallo-hydrolase [Bermanella marisrubri]EAT13179.1 putative secreted protein [Oceanobacter sp. RED65] [Bermanella marisrubri]QIZ83949.1 hypothetical protein HF888_06785 [Bermanella marisrubri]
MLHRLTHSLNALFVGMLTLVLIVATIVLTTSSTHANECKQANSIRYLGVGALDIRYQGQRIITDPYYTPFSIWDTLTLSSYKTDMASVESALGKPQGDIQAVLVGHGHYDHLADLPAMAEYLTPKVDIVASETSINMVKTALEAAEPMYHAMPKDSDTSDWISLANGWIRVKAIPSKHAPQLWNINLYQGHIKQTKKELPKYVWSWKQGMNLTFMLDLLKHPNSDEIHKRVFIQSSAAPFPAGFIESDAPVDMTFFAAASFDNVENYPTGFLKAYQPQQAIAVHWENFFKPWYGKDVEAEPLKLIDYELLEERVKKSSPDSEYSLAQPGRCFYL